MWLADGHGHAQSLQAVESIHSMGSRRGSHAAVDDGVERGSDVAALGRGRSFFDGAELVFTRILLLILAGEREAAVTAITAIMGPLVPKKGIWSVSVVLQTSTLMYLIVLCVAVPDCGRVSKEEVHKEPLVFLSDICCVLCFVFCALLY